MPIRIQRKRTPATITQASSARSYTPEQVAAIYGCSPNHIRNLVKRNQLRAFRLGARLIRIPAGALEEYERCQMNTGSADLAVDGSSHGGKTAAGDAIVLMLPAERTPSGKR